MAICLVTLTIFLVIVVLFLWFHVLSPWLLGIVLLSVLTLALQIAIAVMVPILVSSGDIENFRRVRIFNAVLAVIFPYVLVRLFGVSVFWMLAGGILASLSVLVPLFKYVRAHVSLSFDLYRYKGFERRALLLRFLRYGLPMVPWSVSASIIALSDRYVIGADAGIVAVALYGTCNTLASQIGALVTGPFTNASSSQIMRLWAFSRDEQHASSLISQATDSYLSIGIMLIGGTAAVGKNVVSILLGPHFQGGSIILVPVMIGVIFWGATQIGHKGIEIKEKNYVMMWAVIGTGFLNVVLNLIFIPKLGWWIAAYITLICYGAYAAAIWVLSRSLIPWRIPWMKLVVYSVSALASYAISMQVGLFRNEFLALITRGSTFTVVYVIVVFVVLRARRKSEGLRGGKRHRVRPDD